MLAVLFGVADQSRGALGPVNGAREDPRGQLSAAQSDQHFRCGAEQSLQDPGPRAHTVGPRLGVFGGEPRQQRADGHWCLGGHQHIPGQHELVDGSVVNRRQSCGDRAQVLAFGLDTRQQPRFRRIRRRGGVRSAESTCRLQPKAVPVKDLRIRFWAVGDE